MKKLLHGIAASPGVGVGRVRLYRRQEIGSLRRDAQDRDVELKRFRDAVAQYSCTLEEKARQAALASGQEQADLLLSQAEMAKDPYLAGQVEGKVAAYQSVEAALNDTCGWWQRNFLSSDSEMLRLRAADIDEVRDGLLRVLLGLPETDLSQLPENTILVAEELPLSVMTALDPKMVAGIVLCKGGRASHSAILARAMELPAVVAVEGALDFAREGELAGVDGGEGIFLLSPTEQELQDWQNRQTDYMKDQEALRRYIRVPAVTADGARVKLGASVNGESDGELAEEFGCDGIGMLRSEFLFLNRSNLPAEEEQFQIYRRFVERCGTQPVSIRTLDLGGDKRLPGIDYREEENPFLGCRGLRLCLREPEIFLPQLRAILRVSAFGNVRMTIPMLTEIGELHKVKALLEDCKRGLQKRNVPFQEDLPVGAMIETPAAAVMADLFVREADYLSVGVNDLTQYTMAVDRENAGVAHLYSYYSPALLRLLVHTVRTAHRAEKPLFVCGQAAADPLFLPLLLGMGELNLSVQPMFLLAARRTLSLWSRTEAEALLQTALELETEEEVHDLLEERQRP